MAAKYLMFRNAGTSTTTDAANSGNAEPNATSACWPVSSFLGGFGKYLNRGGSSPHDTNQMYLIICTMQNALFHPHYMKILVL